jgi:uncharacterized protein (TIGR02996 family)
MSRFIDATGERFWVVERERAAVTVTFGAVGENGRARTLAFDDPETAEMVVDRLTRDRLNRGYREWVGGTTAEALERGLWDHRDETPRWAAYADHLIESGDPRGELTRLQFELEGGGLTRVERRRRRAGGEQWAATAGGAEVGRAAVPPLDRPWNPIDDFPFGGDAYTELLPVVAGRLAAHLHAPDRRVRAGEVAPGAHVFEYRGGWWQYVRTLNRRETAGQDYYINIDPSRFDVLFGLVPANRPRLLVRVEADGRPRPAILTWWYGSRYDHRKRRREFLPRAYFDWAARYLGLSADRFAVDTPDKARALFRPRKG